MFNFLFGRQKINKAELFNDLYSKVKELYTQQPVLDERKQELSALISKYGYLPCSQARAINELSVSETIFCLEKKLEINNAFKDNKLIIENNNTSAVKKAGYKDAGWIKKEQHEIKFISLSGLGGGLKGSEPAEFIDMLKQIVLLPAGNKANGIMPCTIYLAPFFGRDFGNAYIPCSMEEISSKLGDKKLKSAGISAEKQVQLFAALAQLAGHPVIFDAVPVCARYSKTVLAYPYTARWIDVKSLIGKLSEAAEAAALKLKQKYDEDDVYIVKNIFKSALKNGCAELTAEFKPIYDSFNFELEEIKKQLSYAAYEKKAQKKLQKRVKEIVSNIEKVKSYKIKNEKNITKRGEIINALIEEGLWTLPAAAWRAQSLPVFDGMSEAGAYPVFKHYDKSGADVSEYAEADLETPLYFSYIETGRLNMRTVKFYIKQLLDIQERYNFDGFRISNTDFVINRAEAGAMPVQVIKKINETMKKKIPYFAAMAEYRLNNSCLKEYHQDMKFDLLWGNDTKTDCEKSPEEVIEDNRMLQNYNNGIYPAQPLSILKTYNNQDGNFRTINRCLNLISREEALFRRFKFIFLPSGAAAQRPLLYADGDESFSTDGIETVIQEEISLNRADDEDFFNKFNALGLFAASCGLLSDGEAQIIEQDASGFACWMISKETSKTRLIIAANYLPENERILQKDKNNSSNERNSQQKYEIKINSPVCKREIALPCDYELVSEYVYNSEKKEYIERCFKQRNIKTVKINKLASCSFKIFKAKSVL